jgi:hypothetical protein
LGARDILRAMEIEGGVETDAPAWVQNTSLEISHVTKLLDNKDWTLELLR